MKQITIQIDDNKYKTFLAFVKTLDFIKIEKINDSKSKILSNIEQGLRDAKAIENGTLKTRPAQQLLDEL